MRTKHFAITAALALSLLGGCIVVPNNNPAAGQYQQPAVGASPQYQRGYNDAMRGNSFDTYTHPQDYKDGYRDGENARANPPANNNYPQQSNGYGGEPPQIMMGTNREGEVIFSNNCVVYYNAQGRRTEQLPACNGDQVRQADDAMARTRRERGW